MRLQPSLGQRLNRLKLLCEVMTMDNEKCERCGEVLDGGDKELCSECLAHFDRVWDRVTPEQEGGE